MPVTYEPLDALVASEPHRFEFFQLLRILEAMNSRRSLIGSSAPLNREFVRLLVHSSFAFPAAEVHELEGDLLAGETPRVRVAFFGLTGCLGALPRCYTDLLLERLGQRDRTLRDFLDLFNHRLLSLFYRAWDKYRFWLHEERRHRNVGQQTDTPPPPNKIAEALLAYVGLLGPGLAERIRAGQSAQRLSVPNATFQFFAGVLGQRRRPAVNLEQLLGRMFAWPVSIDQFVGRWLHLDRSEQTRLSPGSPANIGVTAVVGSKVWDVQSQFRVQNGPLDYEQFSSLLPPGSAHRPLVELTRFYAGPEFDFTLELRLLSDCVPACRMGQSAGLGSHVGWNTWLCSHPHATPTVSVELRVRQG
jgi:type VI secretion system protein ImpH